MIKLEINFLASEERLSLIQDHKLEKDGRKRDRMKFTIIIKLSLHRTSNDIILV